MSTTIPTLEVELDLHRRLMEMDPVATSEFANQYLNPLIEALAQANRGPIPCEFIEEAVHIAIVSLCKNPASFDPSRNPSDHPLFAFLRMSAQRDLQNLLRKEARHQKLRVRPLSIFSIAELSLRRMRSWLQENGVVCESEVEDRRLRAALVASNGHAIAFLDEADSEEERRFSLAHELAHFLRDYRSPRRKVQSRLGAAALEVVDGSRRATSEERFHALLRFAPLAFRVHLLEREERAEPESRTIARVEEDADRLAYELLAPVEHLCANVPDWRRREVLQAALAEIYGLPLAQAKRYAEVLLPLPRRADPLLRRILAFRAGSVSDGLD